MSIQLRRTAALLAGLQQVAALPGEKRAAAIERLISPLGEILDASVALLLWHGPRAPVLMGGGSLRGAEDESGEDVPELREAPRATWWAHWVEPLRAMPTDGVVRRGMLHAGSAGICAAPDGWCRGPGVSRIEERRSRPVMGVGVNMGGERLGLIFLREIGEKAFGVEGGELLASVSEHLMLSGRLAERMERMRHETVTDDLTGIYNYRYLKRTLHGALRRVRDQGDGQLAIMMVDVDHLREYNDLYGHLAASAVLARIGRVLGRHVKPPGWAAKYGGDEFLVVLPRTDKSRALEEAELLRAAVEAARVGEKAFGGITCSFGVAVAPGDGDTYVPVLEAADRVLFRAKAAGRNTVIGTTDKPEKHSDPGQAAA